MGHVDRYGWPLSTESSAAAARYREGIDMILAQDDGPIVALRECAIADPGFALGRAALGMSLLFIGHHDLGREQLRLAQRLAENASRRERRHVAIVAAATLGPPAPARALIDEHLGEFPRDALILLLGNHLWTLSGEVDRRERAQQWLARLAPAYGEDWYFASAHAFLLAETHQWAEAERWAERALGGHPRSRAAVHGLAHVLHGTGRHAECVERLEAWIAQDEKHGQHVHLWWHVILSEMARGRYQRASTLYARTIRPLLGKTADVQIWMEAANILWRKRLYGLPDRPAAWTPVMASGAARLAMTSANLLIALHALVALLGDGGEGAALEQWFAGQRERAARGSALAAELLLPLGEALRAVHGGRPQDAVSRMEPLMASLGRLSASNEQLEVFEDLLITSCLQAGRFASAIRRLQERLERHPQARDLAWLARACCGLGRFDEAEAHARRALSLWQDADSTSPELAALLRLLERHGLSCTRARERAGR